MPWRIVVQRVADAARERFQVVHPRAVIDEADFRDLVNGQAVTLTAKDGRDGTIAVDVILSEIGWERMLAAIADAQTTPSLTYRWPQRAAGPTMTVVDWAIAGFMVSLTLTFLVLYAHDLPRRIRDYRESARQAAAAARAMRELSADLVRLHDAVFSVVLTAALLRISLGQPLMPRIGGELTPWAPMWRCPDCLSDGLQSGPRGGASINLYCQGCGARWNAIPPMQLIQRI